MKALSRREILFAGSAFVLLAGCRATSRGPAESVLADQIGTLEQRHNARVGLYGVNLGSGVTVSNRDNDRFSVCSTFKAYAAGRVLQMSGAGQLRLDDTRYVDPAAVVANSPVTGPKAGSLMTLSEICQAALQRSDNTAGNLLLATIGGPPAITAFARTVGDDATRLDRWETDLNSAIPGDPSDTGTPYALGVGFRNLLTGNALAEPQRAQLEAWMRGTTTSVKSMRAGLASGWTTADKTGAGDYGSTNAIGVAFGPEGQRVLLSIMTRSQADDPNVAPLQPLIAEVTTLAVAELTRS